MRRRVSRQPDEIGAPRHHFSRPAAFAIGGRTGDSASKRRLVDDLDMSHPGTDDALLTAAERARQAEEQLVATPPEDPAIVPNARNVYQRAEEVNELAGDAAEEATDPTV